MPSVKFALRKRAAQLFPPCINTESKQQRRYLQRRWIACISYLGDKWLLAEQVERKGK